MPLSSRNPEKRFRSRAFRIIARKFSPLAVYGLIFYLSSRPASDFPGGIPDIIPHFLEFFLLSFLFMRMFDRPPTRRQAMAGFPVLLTLAVLDETHQLFVPTRFFSVLDLLYDLMGIVAGRLVYFCLENVTDTGQQ